MTFIVNKTIKQCIKSCDKQLRDTGMCLCKNYTQSVLYPINLSTEFKAPLKTYIPHSYEDKTVGRLEIGKYLVIRKDGKIHFEKYNGTGFAYNNESITHYYLPKIN